MKRSIAKFTCLLALAMGFTIIAEVIGIPSREFLGVAAFVWVAGGKVDEWFGDTTQ